MGFLGNDEEKPESDVFECKCIFYDLVGSLIKLTLNVDVAADEVGFGTEQLQASAAAVDWV